jgi:hypothetical protein
MAKFWRCDRCGEDAAVNRRVVDVLVPIGIPAEYTNGEYALRMRDLCGGCLNDLTAFLLGKGAADRVREEVGGG